MRLPLIFGVLVLSLLCLGLTAGTWTALNLWQHHNQQHLTAEKQIQELQAYVNLLLQERSQRAR